MWSNQQSWLTILVLVRSNVSILFLLSSKSVGHWPVVAGIQTFVMHYVYGVYGVYLSPKHTYSPPGVSNAFISMWTLRREMVGGVRALLYLGVKGVCWRWGKMEKESLLLPVESGMGNLTITPCYESSKGFFFEAWLQGIISLAFGWIPCSR